VEDRLGLRWLWSRQSSAQLKPNPRCGTFLEPAPSAAYANSHDSLVWSRPHGMPLRLRASFIRGQFLEAAGPIISVALLAGSSALLAEARDLARRSPQWASVLASRCLGRPSFCRFQATSSSSSITCACRIRPCANPVQKSLTAGTDVVVVPRTQPQLCSSEMMPGTVV
jgi:hypothetical protein